MSEFFIQPKHYRIRGRARKAILAIYDYRLPDADSEHTFQVLLNDESLGACGTKEGFMLRVELPLGAYRVALQLGKSKKSTIETRVSIDSPGGIYGLRVLVAPSFLGFDELRIMNQ